MQHLEQDLSDDIISNDAFVQKEKWFSSTIRDMQNVDEEMGFDKSYHQCSHTMYKQQAHYVTVSPIQQQQHRRNER